MAIYDVDGKVIYADDADSIPFEEGLPALKYSWNDTERRSIQNKCDLFVVAHLSDVHSDPERYRRFLKFVDDNAAYIDTSVFTGDLVVWPTAAEYSGMTAQEVYTKVPLLKSVGNHEKKGEQNTSMTNEQVYANWNQITNTGKLYYYVDFPAQKMRIIALNPYDTEKSEQDSTYSQAQIDWFVDTLKSAKASDYAVIVLRHNFDGKKTVSNNYGFYQRFFWWDGHFENELICSGTPIEDIVHAFQTAGSISETYTFENGAPSITVNTSFSSQGHFVAYLCGHNHADLVGFSPKYAGQLYLCVPQGVFRATLSPSHANVSFTTASDLPRMAGTKSQDCFNLYSFDTKKKQVKILRVGSDMNDLMQVRKMTVIPYNGES